LIVRVAFRSGVEFVADDKQTVNIRPQPASRRSWRLTFRWDGAQIDLINRRLVQMIAPATTGEQPIAGQHAGVWLELRDASDKTLYHRSITRFMGAKGEVFHPSGAMTHHFGDPGTAQFEIVVPDLPEAVSVCVVSSPFEATALVQEPAREIARFLLRNERSERE
jgi:hypothetical protein